MVTEDMQHHNQQSYREMPSPREELPHMTLNERQDRIKDRLNNLEKLFEEEAKHQREVKNKYATAEL